MRYALLVTPAVNRVYGQSSAELGVAELEALLRVDASVAEIGGVRYLEFDADGLSLEVVARLSVAYGLFEREGELLRPVSLPRVDRYDDDLVTIQRYTGKTNEAFTKLLVNLTLPAQATALLDPMAGRGTTLHQAAMYGLDAYGVEVDKKDCDAYKTFFTTWLKNKRIPHKAQTQKIGSDKSKFSVEFAPDRASLDGGAGQTATMTNGDSREVDRLLKKNSVDAIVADLPYNVRHRESSPQELLRDSLPAWRTVLRGGGAVGVAFNTKVMPRHDVVGAFVDAGLVVRDGGPYGRLEHWVDTSITRDVVVADFRG